MNDNDFLIKLFALGLLVGFLVYQQRQRSRLTRIKRRRAANQVGQPIDVAPIRPRLDALKQDFAAAAHVHADSGHARAGLVAKARARLVTLGFFRDHAPDEESERHAH